MKLQDPRPHARLLWSVRRSRTDVQCVIDHRDHAGQPVQVRVLHGEDELLTEVFPEESLALRWAAAYYERLVAQGWFEAPINRIKAS